MTTRCKWPGNDPLYIDYHDKEWGVPLHDERALFEFLSLECQQAGLSWITVLRKRENYRRAFHDFEPEAVARMTDDAPAHRLQTIPGQGAENRNPLQDPQVAKSEISDGPVRMRLDLRVTTSGLLAIGALVTGILLATSGLVWSATSVARRHPVVTRLRRR